MHRTFSKCSFSLGIQDGNMPIITFMHSFRLLFACLTFPISGLYSKNFLGHRRNLRRAKRRAMMRHGSAMFANSNLRMEFCAGAYSCKEGAMRPGQRPISILVACERKMDSELFSQVLNQHAGFCVVACAASVKTVLEAVCAAPVDVALISTALENGPLHGILALQQMREVCPSVKGVILSEGTEAPLAVSVFRAGARGFFCLRKDGIEKLYRCVEQVHDGQIWASSAELLQVLQAFSQSAPPRIVDAKGAQLLTRREEEIVHLVAQSLTNRQIAQSLHLSEHTIRNYLFRIFDKLGISTRVELALYAATSTRRVVPSSADDGNVDVKTNLPSFEPHSTVQ